MQNVQESQDTSTRDKVKQLARKYASDRESILLIVHAASEDITNSGSFDLAKECDQNLERSMVVLTKLDRIEMEADKADEWIRAALRGKLGLQGQPKLGVFGVRGRSLRDHEQGLVSCGINQKGNIFLSF